jgi:hypothetical protein
MFSVQENEQNDTSNLKLSLSYYLTFFIGRNIKFFQQLSNPILKSFIACSYLKTFYHYYKWK